MISFKYFSLLILISISSSIIPNAEAITSVQCSGVKKTFDGSSYQGVFDNFIEFSIAEDNGYLLILGANIPYSLFEITTRTEDSLISNSIDAEGYEWLVTFNRYTGEISFFRSYNLLGSMNVSIAFSNGICKRQERIL